MNNLAELSNDPEFKKRWPYVWQKLEPHLLAKQRAYAAAHKGQHELIGQFVEFLSEIMEDLNTLDVEVGRIEVQKRKPLNNQQFRQ